MKLGVIGKGGAGNTTVAALLARVWSGRGFRVIAIDADSNPNLGLSLGLSLDEVAALAPVPPSVPVGHRGGMTAKTLLQEVSTRSSVDPG